MNCVNLIRAYSVRPISDTDTANMQIRTLTKHLGMYSVKCPLMDAGLIVNLG